ncbi:MAG: chemotaxis protein CheA [Ignavibacteriaceae bacterium]|jgi:two-component system chemotaxis sensor kinase CheA|nr:chemotaxis protein CheA [Ignavibacteriaceae bacterium]
MDNQSKYSMLNDPEMKEIVESFIIETKEILEKLDSDLMELEKRADDADLLNQVFRSFHTIKGTSGFLGLDNLTKVTHKCEDILNKLRKGEVKLNSRIMDAILMAFDNIKALVADIEGEQKADVSIDDTLSALIEVLQEMEKEKAETITVKAEVTEENNYEFSAAELALIAELQDDDEGQQVEESIVTKSNELPETQQTEISSSTKTETTAEVKPPVLTSQNTIASVLNKKGDDTIRVDIKRLDELLNIVSELVLGRNRLTQVNSEALLEYSGTKLSRDLSEAVKLIDIMTNELQLVVMKTRMVKIGKVFNRFPRVVRDLSKEAKKSINLNLFGEDTELDKTLIEEINDPLIHLIRNSVDHGIELPEVRKKSGKSETGNINLSAEQDGNNIIISIEDDGKGIDPDVIKEKAISKGLLSKEKAKELTKQEIFNLIFLPGFSTAEKVTNISGRGVGMDVVKTNVTKLRGIINVESTVGKGTKITIKLPLTLAIIQGMIVKVHEDKLVVPLSSVIEVVRVNAKEIYTINQNEVIRIRDSVISLIDVNELVFHSNGRQKEDEWQYIVVVGVAEKQFGLKVDGLVGQKEVVIKSLGNYLGNIEGIAGSTIMGDGTIVMILDINELINKHAGLIDV